MVFDEDAEFGNRVFDDFESLLQSLQDTTEAVVLNQKQQLFFRPAVVIQARETHVRLARDVAHRGGVITLLRKDARCGTQDEL